MDECIDKFGGPDGVLDISKRCCRHVVKNGVVTFEKFTSKADILTKVTKYAENNREKFKIPNDPELNSKAWI